MKGRTRAGMAKFRISGYHARQMPSTQNGLPVCFACKPLDESVLAPISRRILLGFCSFTFGSLHFGSGIRVGVLGNPKS